MGTKEGLEWLAEDSEKNRLVCVTCMGSGWEETGEKKQVDGNHQTVCKPCTDPACKAPVKGWGPEGPPMDNRTHRDQHPAPTLPQAQDSLIQWLLAHKIWTHPIGPPTHDWRMGALQECWMLDLIYVNPATESIEEDKTLNTAFRVWIEAGPMYDLSKEDQPPEGGWSDHNRWAHSMDTRLCCGGPSLKEAMLKLATLVALFYDGEGVSNTMDLCEAACVEAPDGFCATCGFHVDEDPQ